MKVNRNIPAFTIMEMIVALAISGIVIVMAYAGLLLFNRQFLKYQLTTKTRNEYLLFRNALQSDIENAVSIKDTLDQKALNLVAGDLRLIRYDFKEDYSLRTASCGTDTFFCKGEINKLQYVNESSVLIRSIFIDLVINKTTLSAFFEKEYSAKQLIKEEAGEDE